MLYADLGEDRHVINHRGAIAAKCRYFLSTLRADFLEQCFGLYAAVGANTMGDKV